MKKDLRATWPQALVTLLAPIAVVFCIRWILFEPFVIPSESMVPNLLVHDHIFANKLAYGLRVPFGNGFLWRWSGPQRGDIVVFRYPQNPDVFYVKRTLGLPGDRIGLRAGKVLINGVELETSALPSREEDEFFYFSEGPPSHTVRYLYPKTADFTEVTVPEGHYFMMGDNRDRSSDSRVWGFLPIENVVGRASMIWLSCSETLATAQMVCDPSMMRWERILKGVQ